ncbi:MAG: arginine repressor [Gemmatimonadetes bacterium]|nr:arginine repressor [Gemmatimonadota bacterium]MBK7716669.1 arginine repressor [Gemmatimonadota bacterium]MBK7925313.1 arginine repressor [Gemmatimonadota bacterium]MBK9692568.1 arginine repressor [Gemmatimonadota bacterium]
MKLQRHAAILRIVRERRIQSQDDLREALSTESISVTQATLSRDIRELGLAKLVDPQGGSYYANPHEGSLRPDLGQILPTLMVSLESTGPLIVIKTATGGAPAVAAALDQAGWKEIIGTLAGDDTLLIIAKNPRMRQLVEGRLAALTR